MSFLGNLFDQNSSTDWGNSLEWQGAGSFGLPSEFDLARSNNPDAGAGSEWKFSPTDQNASLLQSLGYTGEARQALPIDQDYGSFGAAPGQAWTDSARSWLDNNGYSLGVGHQPNTSPGGRSEYFGLMDPSGKYVNGQSNPSVTQSDTMMDQITPFLMMAGPFAGAIGAGGAAAEAGAGLGAAESGVTSLGSAWSPQALGLTEGLGSAAGSGATSILPAVSVTGAAAPAAGGLGEIIGGAAAGGAAMAGGSGDSSVPSKSGLYDNQGYGKGMPGAQTSMYDNVLNFTGSKDIANAAINPMLRGAAIGGTKSSLTGGSFAKGAVMGGLTGGMGDMASGTDFESYMNNPIIKGLLGGAISNPNNMGQGAVQGGLAGGLGSLISDEGYGNAKGNSSLINAALGTYLSSRANSGINRQISGLSGLFAPDSAYATQMQQQLDRRDAAAGRRSQYGSRAVELQAALAQQAARSAPQLQQLYGQQQQNRNLMYSNLLKQSGGLGSFFKSPNTPTFNSGNNYNQWQGNEFGDNSGFDLTGGGG